MASLDRCAGLARTTYIALVLLAEIAVVSKATWEREGAYEEEGHTGVRSYSSAGTQLFY